jgi:hypothetical protein
MEEMPRGRPSAWLAQCPDSFYILCQREKECGEQLDPVSRLFALSCSWLLCLSVSVYQMISFLYVILVYLFDQ